MPHQLLRQPCHWSEGLSEYTHLSRSLQAVNVVRNPESTATIPKVWDKLSNIREAVLMRDVKDTRKRHLASELPPGWLFDTVSDAARTIGTSVMQVE